MYMNVFSEFSSKMGHSDASSVGVITQLSGASLKTYLLRRNWSDNQQQKGTK